MAAERSPCTSFLQALPFWAMGTMQITRGYNVEMGSLQDCPQFISPPTAHFHLWLSRVPEPHPGHLVSPAWHQMTVVKDLRKRRSLAPPDWLSRPLCT